MKSVKAIIIRGPELTVVKSEQFNHVLNKKTGVALTWGKEREDDPDMCEFGPLIADIEITTACNGVCGTDGVRKPCSFCYKSNGPRGEYMTLEVFEKLFANLPKTVGQIAFGVDAQGITNPDMFDIMKFCRENFVVPNVTIADISDDVADGISKICGACAVSRYDDKNICYDSVKKLTDRGMKQVNIHNMLSVETFDRTLETIDDIKTDERLSGLKAIVFLSLKQKGRGESFTPLSDEQFHQIVSKCKELGISYGFDSCSAAKCAKALVADGVWEQYKDCVEPCESTLFSSYFDVHGDFYPCSFCEGSNGWDTGISGVTCGDFLKDIWFNERVVEFRKNLLSTVDCNGCRNCPMFNV